MDLLSGARNGIIAFAESIKNLANKAGNLFSDVIESAGTGIYDLLSFPGKSSVVKQILAWIASIFKGTADIIAAILKGSFNMAGGILCGTAKIAGGLILLKPVFILLGVLDIFSPVAGTLIVVAGRTLSAFQSLLLLQGMERRLRSEETGHLKKVFGKSLQYNRIRIIEGRAGLFGLNDRAFTLGNTIYVKNDHPRIDLLVHECTHAWQYRHLGVTYASDALGAQLLIRDAYNWELELNSRGKKDWKEFNMESQAEFLQDLWESGEKKASSGISLRGNGAFYEVDWKTETGVFRKSGNNFTLTAQNALTDLWRG